MASEKRMRTIERNSESKLEQKLLTPASWDNCIKADVVVVIIDSWVTIFSESKMKSRYYTISAGMNLLLSGFITKPSF